ncbi:MAG: pLS20_p028 family conjugation system transmembrane protein, partial [Bacilli bacterium]
MQILEKLLENNILELTGIVTGAIRWILWKIIILLTMLVNGVEKAITKIYNVNGFFYSQEVNSFIDRYKPIVWVILAISVGILGFKIMFNKKQNRGELPANILFSILILVLLPTLMVKLENMTSLAVKDVASEYTSSANQLIKNNVYDLYYLDSNGFDLTKKNNINEANILNISENETIDEDEVQNKTVFSKKLVFDKNGNKKLEDLDKGWLKIDEEYYRYGIDFLTIIVTLSAMGITLICIGLKVARLIFELAFNKFLATLFAFADIGDGKKLKEIVKHIFSIFAVIFATAVMTKLYVLFSSWLGTSLGNAGLSTNGIAKLIILVGASIAVIDGPNIIERILGIDAGLKNGWSAVMASYGLGKGVASGVSALGDGAKKLGRSALMGASMGAG